MSTDRFYMEKVVELAQGALLHDEVPVGALLVKGSEIVAMSFNSRERDQNPLGHAEIEVIEAACKRLGTWRLEDTTLYVSVEPCLMCTGLIYASRISKVVFGCKNPKGGSLLFVQERRNELNLNHSVEVVQGVLESVSSSLMKNFFHARRNENRIKKSGICGTP